jgi:hypothetical protein
MNRDLGRALCVAVSLLILACSAGSERADGGSVPDGAASCPDVAAYPVQAPPQSILPTGKPCASSSDACELSAVAPCPPGEVGGPTNAWQCVCKDGIWACVITYLGTTICAREPGKADAGGDT